MLEIFVTLKLSIPHFPVLTKFQNVYVTLWGGTYSSFCGPFPTNETSQDYRYELYLDGKYSDEIHSLVPRAQSLRAKPRLLHPQS